MPEFWEQYRNRVLAHTTSADVAVNIYQKVATTGVMAPAIVKPSYCFGHASVLMMDFVDHVERLLNTPSNNLEAQLRSVTFMRECCRSLKEDISQAADPTERLVTMLEDVVESEELVAMEDADVIAAAEDEDESQGGEEDEGEEIDRDALAPQRESLEEALRDRLGQLPEGLIRDVSSVIGAVYTECVQFARELDRLGKAPDEDTSTIMAIIMDLQFGLDSQLRNLLMEDIDTSDLEPTYTPGFFTHTSLLVAELMDRIHAAKPPETAAALGAVL